MSANVHVRGVEEAGGVCIPLRTMYRAKGDADARIRECRTM